MRNISAFVMYFVLSLTEIFSQVVTPMDFTYWFYRHRIHREFSKPGSLPSGIDCPDPNDENLSGFQLVADRLHIDGQLNQTLYGDGTIYLGWYISVLATEYMRLGGQGLSVNGTLSDLYYCYRAVDRNLFEIDSQFTHIC